MPELHDIIETNDTAPLLFWWQWTLLGILAIALMWLAKCLITRSKSATKRHALSELELAIRQLNALDLTNTDSNRLAVHLSLIVRQYLQTRFSDAALFETEEEFHERSEQLDTFPSDIAAQLRNYLSAVVAHKYAPNRNHPAALEGLVKKAEELLKTLDANAKAHTKPLAT